jgi:putative membrane protein
MCETAGWPLVRTGYAKIGKAVNRMRGYNFGGFEGHMGGFGGGAMLFGGLIFLALLVVGIIVVIRLLKPRQAGTNNSFHNTDNLFQNVDSAMRILNERYAKGEMPDEEYATKKAELRK